MPDAAPSFVTLLDFPLAIGESPVWDCERRVLWFVDILRPAVFAYDPATERTNAFEMPAAVGCVGLAKGGGLIVALRTGVHLFDPGSRRLDFLVHPEPGVVVNRLNDGRVGPDGCFWVGSMHDAMPREPTAALYRVCPDGSCTKVLADLRVSNGLAWSPDGRVMYHADSRRPSVTAYDFDPRSGTLGAGRLVAAPDEAMGLPDGAAVDADGFYWSAGVTAGRINKLSPAGGIVGSFDVPAPAPTMPCFGGDDLRTMYITSLATERTGHPVGGTLLACPTSVPGIPEHRFG